MTIPIIADAEDPTTQVAWPASKRSQENLTDGSASSNGSTSSGVQRPDEHAKIIPPVDVGKQRLSTWNLITLSISMAGAQIAWTVELGYGTPFLLTLGVSEQLTSLVWLAGPISGLIAQPLIGAISDSSPSKYRRRYWIALSTGVLVLSTLTLAYCEVIAAFVVDLFGVGAGDWDAKRTRLAANTAIGIAVFQFYLLDFALNALQASLRNLLLDITPSSQLNAGNAWHGRMTHLGNIVGFGFGFLPLAKLPLLNLLGGDQFRKFCILAMAILVATVWVTFFFHEELERDNTYKKQSKFRDVLENIVMAVVKLPKPIRRVCYVQVFAFMGWFPFLFYSTTYVGQVMAYESGEEPDGYDATRKGEFAMLLYSLVAVAAGTLLPHLAGRDRRLMPHKGDVDEDAELSRLKNTVREWRAEASRRGKPLRLPVMPFLLRNIWTGALLLFSIITFSTFFITTVAQATVAISLVGICWAVACWVPFAIIMELLKELDTQKPPVQAPPSTPSVRRPSHGRAISTPTLVHRDSERERQPLIRRRSYDAYDAGINGDVDVTPIAGGTVLGIHNLARVFPQLIVALAASLIFRLVDDPIEGAPPDDNKYLGKNGVAWVLRFGGLCTLFAAALARKVPPTPTEKAMRRRLGEMRELQQETSL
jgi:solute carrier family 45 protein 1/2/4